MKKTEFPVGFSLSEKTQTNVGLRRQQDETIIIDSKYWQRSLEKKNSDEFKKKALKSWEDIKRESAGKIIDKEESVRKDLQKTTGLKDNLFQRFYDQVKDLIEEKPFRDLLAYLRMMPDQKEVFTAEDDWRLEEMAQVCGVDVKSAEQIVDQTKRGIIELLNFTRQERESLVEKEKVLAHEQALLFEVPEILAQSLVEQRVLLLAPLGEQGGMGIVFDALNMDEKLATDVVVKFVLTAKANIMEKFRREAIAAASLKSIYRTKIQGAGFSDQGVAYYIMEKAESGDVHSLMIEDEGCLPEKDVIEMAEQVAGVLVEAHAKGLVHRDIKPANIFLNEEALEYPNKTKVFRKTYKLGDFGLVLSLGEQTAKETRLASILSRLLRGGLSREKLRSEGF